jgi:hypothetical protein
MPEMRKPDYSARREEAVRVSRNEDGSLAIGAGRLTVAPDDIAFARDAVRDIGRLVYLAEGEEALREGDAMGRPVRIAKPEAPTAPPNAWIVPDDLAAAGNGTGCGSTVFYDPHDWPRPNDPRSPSSAEILLTLLRQANVYAAGKSAPAKSGWGVEETGAER